MKKNKKLLVGAIVTLLIVAVITATAVFALSSQKAVDILSAIVNGEEYLEENDLNGDDKVDVLDAILAIRQDNFDGPKLTSLDFDDDAYSVKFNEYTLAYTVNLPAGRPRIPKLVATAAEGCTVTIEDATIADTESWGSARATVSNGNKSNTYTVKFVRAEVVDSVVLQYDDRYTFTPDYTLANGEKFTFVSSNAAVVSVDENGVLTAENVSNTPVTVKAMVGDVEKDCLTVTKIDKARVNLFFVTGQSNAQGCYDYSGDVTGDGIVNDEDRVILAPAQHVDIERPETSGRVYSYDVCPGNENLEAVAVKRTLYDMAEVARQGFASALGKTYYNLSGEKVVFFQAAFDGSPIERWLDPEVHGSLAEDFENRYVAMKEAYPKLMQLLDGNLYDINHRANFWLQGETCMWYWWDYANNTWGEGASPEHPLLTDEDYAGMFLKFNAQMVDDFGIETNNILLVRGHNFGSNPKINTDIKAGINEVRAAQYGLANTYDNISIVSRFSDYTSAFVHSDKYAGTIYEPYVGTMGVGGIHYNQTGHNINGRWAATNYFKSIDVDTNSVATSVEIIDTDGVTRLESDTVFTLEKGDKKRLAAFALPEYSLENVIWSSSNENVAKIDEYGLITVTGAGEAVITATAENGVKASITVKGWEKTYRSVHYRWDFSEGKELESTYDENTLTMSPLSVAANANSYKIENGLYTTTTTGLTDNTRPVFSMSKPVVLSRKYDWSVEWRSQLANLSGILGQEENSVNKHFMYAAYGEPSYQYALKIDDDNGGQVFLPYADNATDAINLNTKAMRTWKVDYVASTNTMSLKLLNETTSEWTTLSTCLPTEAQFSEVTYTCLFGRFLENGMVNFCGTMDYMEIYAKTIE